MSTQCAAEKYTNEQLNQWKRQINPAVVIRSRISIRRENAEFVGCCPDVFHKTKTGHSDTHPSFKIYKMDDGIWAFKCFSCGSNGNVFQFVEKFDGIRFKAAVEKVLAEAGVEGYAQEGQPAQEFVPDDTPQKEYTTFPITSYAPAITAFERATGAHKWLESRGIGLEVARQFQLGYVQSATLYTPKNDWMNDGWILFPTLSADGRTVTAIKCRSIVAKKIKRADGSKNSGILRAPNTSTTMYNMNAVVPHEDIWIVEGEPDTLVMTQAGQNTVGLPMAGYKPSDEEIEILSSLPKRRFIAGDNDYTGSKATELLQKKLRGETYVIRWASSRKDANDVLTNDCGNDAGKFRALVEGLKTRATQNPHAESGNSPPPSKPVGDYTKIDNEKKASASSAELVFNLPVVEGGHRDWVFEPSAGMYEGLFPRGAVSLIAATSGGGKTTLMIQALLAQRVNAQFFGHAASAGYSFAILGADRGSKDLMRTTESMHLTKNPFPFERLPLTAFDREAVQSVINIIEAMNPMPEIVFLEGLDMMVTNGNDMRVVSSFLNWLQKVAERYHIAIIGSVGSPKAKEGHGYNISRENILGSGAWGRGSATVITIQFPKGDDSTAKRIVKVLPRRAKPERLTMEFQK
jgi:CHC2 zinc finger/AAA domain/Toprim-like